MKTIKDLDINNKRVIIRFDYNVPIKNGVIEDDTRIVKSLKTLNYVRKCASKVIILSHLGRIKTLDDKNNNSLRIVCDYLSSLLNEKVAFSDYSDAYKVIENNKIIMMENTRFFDLDNNKESNNDLDLAKYFASFGDVFIDDAFGVSHRLNASNVGIANFLPSCNGYLMEEEINNLELLNNAKTPYTVILGGSKVSDKIKLIDNIIDKIDYLLIGGGMVYTFLKSLGKNIGNSICEDEYIDYSKKLLNKYRKKIVLIEDNFININENISIDKMRDSDKGLDVGINSVENFKKYIDKSKTVFFNGPLGLFEEGFEYGTREILDSLNNSSALVVIGGGDTVNAVNKILPENKFIISTGGGASLEYLEGKKLPGIIEE